MDDRPQRLIFLHQDDAWGREKTLDYAKCWAANKPSVEASGSTAAHKLAVGAYHLICGALRVQEREQNEHAGVKPPGIVFPLPVSFVNSLVYVPRS
jgi:hypothetical protein